MTRHIVAYCDSPDCDWGVSSYDTDVADEESWVHAMASVHNSFGMGHHSVIEKDDLEENRPHDEGPHLCGQLSSEKELQVWLEDYFENHGWTAIREASPHNSNHSADLIVNHAQYGWFGIETKFFDNDGGAKAADAHHQITRKYRGRKYLGHHIDRWAVCPYFKFRNCSSADLQRQQYQRSTFLREMFCRHGIGYVDLDRWQLLLDFAYSNKSYKVPVGGQYLDDYLDAVDIEAIDKSVERKMAQYDYR